MINHLIAFIMGFLLDQVIGDPHNIPHPIRLIGSGIAFFERVFLGEKERDNRREDKSSVKGGNTSQSTGNDKEQKYREFICGVIMCVSMIAVSAGATALILYLAYSTHRFLGVAVEAVLTCYILAAKRRKDESMKVHHAIKTGTIEDARYAVSMIVGRDTKALDAEGVARAAVETVAENTSDGVIAPLIYTFIGGPVGGFIYKTINTMDSMTGYHSDKYEYFGKAAAKIDDVVNFIPSRISAVLMIVAAAICGKDYSAKRAISIFVRDRYKHKSPNSAQTESACAGALSVRLAGPASYFGKVVDKPYIGDDIRPIEADDIKRACKLMYMTEYLCMAILVFLALIFKICQHC